MPQLDVSFVLFDPMLSDTFDVIRRQEDVGIDGRVMTISKTFPKVRGVVTQANPADLTRSEDGQLVPRVIEVVSVFRFREAVEGFQPDLIRWRGTDYLLTEIYPYTSFGKGFSRIVAKSLTMPDKPQD